MVNMANNGRRRVEIDLIDLFTAGRTMRRPKPKKPVTAAATPTPAVSPPPPPPADALGPPPGPPPGSPPGPPAGPSAAPPAPTTETASGWTAERDAQLLELKAKETPWKAISMVIEAKGGIQELKERYKELTKDENDQSKGDEIGGETDKEDKSKKDEDGREGNGGGAEKEGKGQKGNQGKGKGKEKHEEMKLEEKKDENKRPIIYMDEGDELSIKELVYMYRLAEEYEEEKWLKVASKLFDKTGKRVDPKKLAERLGADL